MIHTLSHLLRIQGRTAAGRINRAGNGRALWIKRNLNGYMLPVIMMIPFVVRTYEFNFSLLPHARQQMLLGGCIAGGIVIGELFQRFSELKRLFDVRGMTFQLKQMLINVVVMRNHQNNCS